MADLSVIIGLDMKELEAGLKEAGNKIQGIGGKGGENPFQKYADKFQSAAGIGGMIAGPLGAGIGAFIDAFKFAIDKVIDYVKDLISYATKLRNLSIATGVSSIKLQQMEGLADASGVSLETLAHAMNEFNKRMGEAQRKGGEVLPILAKLGIGLQDVRDGSFDSVAAMKALAAAYEAGTDEQTLAYYGTKLFGSAFEQLLPIIKRGTVAIDEYSKRSAANTESQLATVARLGEDWDNFWRMFKMVMVATLAEIADKIYSFVDGPLAAMIAVFAKMNPEAAGRLAESISSPAHSKAQRAEQLFKMTALLTDDEKKKFFKGYFGEAGPEGKKLTPFGLSEAGAASQMQAMGGGDIFGAVAFSPLQQIEKNTKETAENTRPKAESAAPAVQTPLLK